MTGEPNMNGAETGAVPGQASSTTQGHVNSIKTFLGLDRPESPLGRLAAHTKRKMAELEAAKASAGAPGAAASTGAANWSNAMQSESFFKAFIKANRTQFIISMSLFALMAFWLIVIRTLHHDSNSKQTATSEAQVQAGFSSQQNAGQQPQAQTAPDAAQNFGAPAASFGSPINGTYTYQPLPTAIDQSGSGQVQSQAALQQVPPPQALPPQAMPPQAYSPQAAFPQHGAVTGFPASAGAPQPMLGGISSHPSYGTGAPYPQGAPGAAVNFGAPHQSLYPERHHTAQRHQVVVNR